MLTAHVEMSGDSKRGEITDVKKRVMDLLDEKDFTHVTIDVELEGEECASSGETD